jgi:hypothetical protein
MAASPTTSRSFFSKYLELGIFGVAVRSADREGVGRLVRISVERAAARPV